MGTTKAIQGSVKDMEGNPMPGVTIMADGTNAGTITNTDGKYSINVPEKENHSLFLFRIYLTNIGYNWKTDYQCIPKRRFDEN